MRIGKTISVQVYVAALLLIQPSVSLAHETAAPARADDADPAHSLDEALHHFSHVDASRSLVELYALLPGLREMERATARFLIASAFAELGLYDTSFRELERARRYDLLEGPALAARCRILADLGNDHELLRTEPRIPWDRLSKDDAAELAYLLGQASFRLGQYGATRAWLKQIPPDSSLAPFANYLRAQNEFAIGKYGRAIAAAKPILDSRPGSPTIRQLRDRAAIFLGDLYTELGRYGDAVENLRRPAEDSPFAARAQRDLLVAAGLADLSQGRFDDAEPVVERLHTYLQVLADEIEESVGSPEKVSQRAVELRGVWPPKFIVYARREWAATRARQALALSRHGPPAEPAGLLHILGSTPVFWSRDPRKRDPWLPQREATARFFFPPSPEIARLLSGLALLEDSPADYGQPCPILAATAIRRRIAAWTLGRADPPSEDELQKLSATCRDEPPRQDLVTSGWQSLFDEIRAEAERVRKKFRRDELEIEQAIGRAYLKHTAELRAAQAEKRASPRGPAIVVR